MKRLILMLTAGAAALPPAAAGQEREIFRNGRWEKAAPAKPADRAGEPAAPGLQAVRSLIAAGRYKAAADAARAAAAAAPDADTLQEARLLLGDCLVLSDRMSDARSAYDEVLADAGADRWYEAALEREYELAWHWVVGGRKRKVKLFGVNVPLIRVPGSDEGFQLLRDIRSGTTKPDLSARCLFLSAEKHFSAGDFEAADLDYQQLRKGFPGTPYARAAELQAAFCLLAQFKGTGYCTDWYSYSLSGNTGLRQTQRVLEGFRQTDPSEAARRDLDVLIRGIDWVYARRDYETAEFYRRLGDIRPAIKYYEFIVRDHPGSPWRERAMARLIELGAREPESAR